MTGETPVIKNLSKHLLHLQFSSVRKILLQNLFEIQYFLQKILYLRKRVYWHNGRIRLLERKFSFELFWPLLKEN